MLAAVEEARLAEPKELEVRAVEETALLLLAVLLAPQILVVAVAAVVEPGVQMELVGMVVRGL
jgi:hypothetical protein